MTFWYSAVNALITSICCVVKALIQLQNDHTPKPTPKPSADARSRLPRICAFDFVFSLVETKKGIFNRHIKFKVISNDIEILINEFAGKHGRNTQFSDQMLRSDAHVHTHIRSHILYLQCKNQLILHCQC